MSVFPPFDLRIETPLLELRLPSDPELEDLAVRSCGQVLPSEQAQFMGGWTQLPSPEFERSFCQYHWAARAGIGPQRWELLFAVFPAGERHPVGSVGLSADDFAMARTVSTGSWLLPRWRRRGLGLQARAGLLALAFWGLGARRARSTAHPDNAASRRVSETLGYRHDGTEESVGDGRMVELVRYVLAAEDFRPPAPVRLEGVEPCLELLGATAARQRQL